MAYSTDPPPTEVVDFAQKEPQRCGKMAESVSELPIYQPPYKKRGKHTALLIILQSFHLFSGNSITL